MHLLQQFEHSHFPRMATPDQLIHLTQKLYSQQKGIQQNCSVSEPGYNFNHMQWPSDDKSIQV
jgi:hypothetical protein